MKPVSGESRFLEVGAESGGVDLDPLMGLLYLTRI